MKARYSFFTIQDMILTPNSILDINVVLEGYYLSLILLT